MAMRGTSTQVDCGPILFPCKIYTVHETVRDGMTNIHTPSLCDFGSNQTLNERKYCPACEREVGAAEITKAYKLNTKTLVPLAEDEIASLPVKSTKEIEVVQFFSETIDVRYHAEHLYYIGPDGKAKAYQLLITAMQKAGVKALARFKKSLYVIEPFNGVLMMREIVYAANLREPGEILEGMKKASISEKEQNAVGQLVAGMTTKLDLTDQYNVYMKALEKLVEDKQAGKVIDTTPTVEVKATDDDALADAVMVFLNKQPKPEGGVIAGQQVPVVDTVTVPAGATVEMPQVKVEDEDVAVLPW